MCVCVCARACAHAVPLNYRFLYMKALNFGLCASILEGYCPFVFIHAKGWFWLPCIWWHVRQSFVFDLAVHRTEFLLGVKGCSDSLLHVVTISSVCVMGSLTNVRACVMNGTELYAVLAVSCAAAHLGREQLMGSGGESSWSVLLNLGTLWSELSLVHLIW
jgi:hypothetical protein